MLCLLIFLINCRNDALPYYSLMIAGQTYLLDYCTELKEMFDENYKQLEKVCKNVKKGDDIYESCRILMPLKSIHCISEEQLDDELSRVSKDAKLLLIQMSISSTAKINFNRLAGSADTFITIGGYGSYKSIRPIIQMDDVAMAFNKAFKLKIPIENNNKQLENIKDTGVSIELVGNIGNKVPSLSLFGSYANLKITEGDLNNENLYLEGFDIDTNSKNIRCKRLINDGTTHINILNHPNKELVKVDQYGINLADEEETKFQIVLNQDKWTLNKKVNNQWVDYAENDYNKVSYSYAKSLCLMSLSNNYDINVPDANVKSVQDVNITVTGITFPEIGQSITLDDEKRTLSITKSGNWDGIPEDKLPKIVVNADSDEFDIKIDESFKNDLNLDVEQQKPFEYKEPKKNKKNIGLIVGVTIACVVVVAVVIVVVIIVIRKKKNQNKSNSEGENDQNADN